MTIPIRNLYYLFLYAWSQFRGGAMVEPGSTKVRTYRISSRSCYRLGRVNFLGAGSTAGIRHSPMNWLAHAVVFVLIA
jgi:hypothetical protein